METADELTRLMREANRRGYQNIMYVTDMDMVGPIESGLREDFGHLFEKIDVVPAAYLTRLREADQPVQPAAQQTAPQPAQPAQPQQPAQPAAQVAEPIKCLLFPFNAPLAGTKSALTSIVNDFNLILIPSVSASLNQFIGQDFLVDSVNTIISGKKQDIFGVGKKTFFVNSENAQTLANEVKTVIAQAGVTAPLVVYTSKAYASLLTGAGFAQYQKGVQTQVGMNYFATLSSIDAFPNTGNNSALQKLCDSIATDAFNDALKFDMEKVKGKDSVKKDSLDEYITELVSYFSKVKSGEISNKHVATNQYTSNVQKWKNIFGKLVNKNDIEAINKASDYLGLTLALDAVKGIKTIADELSKDGKGKQATEKPKELTSSQEIAMKIYYHKDYQTLKKMFDTPSF
jgi:hypothetical protein